MNAPDKLQQLLSLTREPFPQSRKVHVPGTQDGVHVPMREIALTNGEAVTVYDTSGPYTDPDARIDLATGLPALRAEWIAERGDSAPLPGLSSDFGRERAADTRLDAVRFPALRPPRRALAGANVTQMHYARRGIVTPEMEYIAIRENLQRREYIESLKASGPTGAKMAALLGRQHPGECCTTGFADRQSRRIFLAGEAEMLQQISHAIGIVARPEPRFCIGLNGGITVEIRCLLQIADRRGRMAEHLAGLCFDNPGGNLHQGRFARAVAADEADPVARFDLQAGACEQGRAAEGKLDVIEFQNGRRQGFRLRKNHWDGRATWPGHGKARPRSAPLRCWISCATSRRATGNPEEDSGHCGSSGLQAW